MAKWIGVVRRSDLSGGFWQLVTDDGQTYQLQGGDAGLHQDGRRVEIDGRLQKHAMGIGMSGPILTVTTYRLLG